MGFRSKNPAVVGLASCILGLVVSPYVYVAFGAQRQFPLAFSLITLPPLLLGSGFLFWRFLSRPTPGTTSKALLAVEGVCLLIVVIFLVLISRFSLFTTFE